MSLGQLEDDLNSGKLDKVIINSIPFKKWRKNLRKDVLNVIDDYYNSYSPSFYDRKYSLRRFYESDRSFTDDMDIITDTPNIILGKHRVSNEYIYNKMFVEGWHGGANIDGNMLIPYRKPPIAYNGTSMPFADGKKASWKSAEQSTSVKYQIDDISENDIYLDDIIQEVASKVLAYYGI